MWCDQISQFYEEKTTYCFVRIRRDAEGFLERRAILVHAKGEVSIAFVHGRDPFLNLSGVGVALITEPICQLYQQLHPLFGLLRTQARESALGDSRVQDATQSLVMAAVRLYLGCDVEVLVLLQKLLRVVDAGARGGVRGQIELAGVVDPLQSLENEKETL